jgi:carbon storage regulator
MLVLTRNVGTSIIIGDAVKVTILGTKGNQVKVGIDAPRDISVHRNEVYDRIKLEQKVRENIDSH